MATKRRNIPLTRTSKMTSVTNQRLAAKKKNTKSEPLAEIVTQAALAGPIGRIWSAPEEDEAWAHLKDLA